MKTIRRKIVLLFCVLAIGISVSAHKDNDEWPVFQINRSGGKLVTVHRGFLGLFHEQYVGYENVRYSNKDGVLRVNCEGPGVQRCRVVFPDGRKVTFSIKENTFFTEGFEEVFDIMLISMEDAIAIGEVNGFSTRKVSAVSIEGKRVNLVFKLTWNLDKEGSGVCYMTVKEFKV